MSLSETAGSKRVPRPVRAGLTLAFSLLCGAAFGQAELQVTGASPEANALDAPAGTAIDVTFGEPLDVNTVDEDSLSVFGRWSGVATGAVTVLDAGHTLRFRSERPFFAGELVSIQVSSSLRGLSGVGLPAGFGWQFWVRSMPASGLFELDEVKEIRLDHEFFLQAYGVSAVDLDRDGDPDFSIPCEFSDDVRVLENDGCGGFSGPVLFDVPAGAKPSSNEAHDFNGDGWPDLVTVNFASDSMTVLLGDGFGGYLPQVTYATGDTPRGVSVLDVEGDGDIDVAVANRGSSNVAVHLNRGDGTFASPTFFEAGGNGETTLATVDADGDGTWDLYVGNYHSGTVTVARGNTVGGFVVSGSATTGSQPWTIAAGDLNGDGVVDATTANSATDNATIVFGDGNAGFLPPQSLGAGSFPLSVDLGDLDGDGDLDLVVSNYVAAEFWGYPNDGNGQFSTPFQLTANQAGSCAALVDYDRDGRLDLVGLDELTDQLFLYRRAVAAPAGVQPSACDAILRVDNASVYAGFAASDPHEVQLGSTLFFGVSARPNSSFLLGLGVGIEPGFVGPFGILNLSPLSLIGVAETDGRGEGSVRIEVPDDLPIGLTVAFQALVNQPSQPGPPIDPSMGRFTNSEVVVLVP